MTRTLSTGLLSALLLICCLVGCQASPGINKQYGAYHEWVPASVKETADATNRAFDALNIQLVGDKITPEEYKIVGRNTYNTKIIVTLRDDGKSTDVGVRIDPGESEGYSLTVLNGIKHELGLTDRR